MTGPNVFTLSPDEEEEMLIEIADREIDLLKEALKQVHDDGYVIFGPSKPAQQLWGTIARTLPTEVMMLLDEDYLAKMDAGIYPPPQPDVWLLMGPDGKEIMRPSQIPGLQCSVFASQQEAVQWGQLIGLITPEMLQPQLDPMTGQQMAPQLPVEKRPNMWAQFLQCGRFDGGKSGPAVWELADLRRLWNAYGRRIEQVL